MERTPDCALLLFKIQSTMVLFIEGDALYYVESTYDGNYYEGNSIAILRLIIILLLT